MNESPLGAAALAGSPFPIDRDMTAAALGFDRPTANSLDSVSARDFALEALAAATICATHLSRLAEEIVLWMTPQFGFIRLSDAFTTGSSIMPQKRNPDAAELVRAKAGRILGAFTALTVVMKGLPLAYSKDMQEDKAPLFEAFDALELCLAAMAGMVADLTVDEPAMAAAAGAGFSTATDLADWLVRELGLPFREAHHITGAAVKRAEALGVRSGDLPLAELQALEPRITAGVYKVLTPRASVASRTSYGGTAPAQVRAQIARWKEIARMTRPALVLRLRLLALCLPACGKLGTLEQPAPAVRRQGQGGLPRPRRRPPAAREAEQERASGRARGAARPIEPAPGQDPIAATRRPGRRRTAEPLRHRRRRASCPTPSTIRNEPLRASRRRTLLRGRPALGDRRGGRHAGLCLFHRHAGAALPASSATPWRPCRAWASR